MFNRNIEETSFAAISEEAYERLIRDVFGGTPEYMPGSHVFNTNGG